LVRQGEGKVFIARDELYRCRRVEEETEDTEVAIVVDVHDCGAIFEFFDGAWTACRRDDVGGGV